MRRSARRAERRADGELVLAADRGGEEQVADVGAGDEQHERDRGLQEQQHRPLRARRARCRHSTIDVPRWVALVVGIFDPQARHDRVEILPRLLDGHARAQPSGDAQEPGVARRASRIRVHRKRRDDLRVADRRDERGRQHADDGVGVAVQDERRAERPTDSRRSGASRTGASARRPSRRSPARPRAASVRPSAALRAEHREERRGGLHALDALGLAAGEVRAPLERRGKAVERPVAVAQIAVVGNRQRLVRRVGARLVDGDQPRRDRGTAAG